MSKNYDMIATVDIDIATPIVDDTSFDNLLIMGPAPKTGAKSPARVGVYFDPWASPSSFRAISPMVFNSLTVFARSSR